MASDNPWDRRLGSYISPFRTVSVNGQVLADVLRISRRGNRTIFAVSLTKLMRRWRIMLSTVRTETPRSCAASAFVNSSGSICAAEP